MSDTDRDYSVPVDEAMNRLAIQPEYDCGNGPEPCVHTFMDSQIGLLGAHWALPDVREFFERWGAEESGPDAQSMRHGLVAIAAEDGKRTRTVFFETAAPADGAA